MRLSHLILSCKEKHKVHNITVIRIAEYINTVVGTRRIINNTAGSLQPAVVMKLDVEVKILFYDCSAAQFLTATP